jgi:hypothetical protein
VSSRACDETTLVRKGKPAPLGPSGEQLSVTSCKRGQPEVAGTLWPTPVPLLHTRGVDAVAQLAVEALDIEADRRGAVPELGVAQLVLVVEEAIVHLPEATLCAGRLGRFSRGPRAGMQVGQRHVTEHETKSIAKRASSSCTTG